MNQKYADETALSNMEGKYKKTAKKCRLSNGPFCARILKSF